MFTRHLQIPLVEQVSVCPWGLGHKTWYMYEEVHQKVDENAMSSRIIRTLSINLPYYFTCDSVGGGSKSICSGGYGDVRTPGRKGRVDHVRNRGLGGWLWTTWRGWPKTRRVFPIRVKGIFLFFVFGLRNAVPLPGESRTRLVPWIRVFVACVDTVRRLLKLQTVWRSLSTKQ